MKFLVSHDKKLIIGWNRKCACTSIKKWFFDYLALDVDYRKVHPFLRANRQYKGIEPSFDYKGYVKVLVIRNPYIRVVSGYMDKYVFYKVRRGRYKTFKYFVDALDNGKVTNNHFIPQTGEDFINLKWNFIFTQDYLTEGFEILSNYLNVSISLSNLHQRPKRIPYESMEAFNLKPAELMELRPEWRHFYNKQIRDKVAKYYKDDFNYFSQLGFIFPGPFSSKNVNIKYKVNDKELS